MEARAEQAKNSSLNKNDSYAMMDSNIIVSRRELEAEHRNLLERIHQLRRILDYPPLLTGKQQRK
jgi:hypothetical protein